MPRALAFVSGLFGLALAILVSIIGAPSFDDGELREIGAGNIRYAPANTYLVSRRIQKNVPETYADRARDTRNSAIQIAATLPERYAATSTAILATGLSGTTRLFANGVPAGDTTAFGFRPTGMGRAWALSEIDTSSHVTLLERLDFIVPEGTDSVSSFRMWASETASPQTLRDKLESSIEVQRDVSWFGAIIGLVSAVLGLLLSKNIKVFVGGAMISAAQLTKFWGISEAIGTGAADTMLIAGSLAGLALMALASIAINTPLRAFLLGLMLCAAIGLAVSIWSLAGITELGPSLRQLHFSNVSAIPAIALGLPVLVLLAFRETIGSLVSAGAAVAERDAIIGKQEAELQDQVRKQAVLEERQRFVRDMHDGVGGQLLNLLVKVRGRSFAPGDIEREIERSIADLRLVVDSLDHVGNDLATALESFRGRTSVQLTGGGIALDWHEEGPIADWTFDARQVLSIYRIMQEAIGNAVRHAKANAIRVSVVAGCPTEGNLRISIVDNGAGFDADASPVGRGLGNMRNRATRLGGDLTIESEPGGGTRIEISLPAAP